MNRKISLLLVFLTFGLLSQAQLVYEPDSLGMKLRQIYLDMHVETLWQNGVHVDWRTGEPDNPDATTENATHCSAFVAAACAQMDIYILRPPAHAQELLANAQFRWLHTPAAQKQGWRKVSGTNVLEKAQKAANKGYMVLAAYKNPNPQRAGHIVCIMPSRISIDSIAVWGPKVIQSSRVNSSNVSFRIAFKRVLNGWPATNVQFFYHESRMK